MNSMESGSSMESSVESLPPSDQAEDAEKESSEDSSEEDAKSNASDEAEDPVIAATFCEPVIENANENNEEGEAGNHVLCEDGPAGRFWNPIYDFTSAAADGMSSKDNLTGEEIPAICSMCRIAFINHEVLRIHIRRYHDMQLRYLICSDKECLDEIQNWKELGKGGGRMTSCGKMFHSFYGGEDNKATENNNHQSSEADDKEDESETLFECKTCHFSFRTKHELRTHGFVHLKDSVKCDHCDEFFSDMEAMKEHRLLHKDTDVDKASDDVGSNGTQHKCKECSKTFRQLAEFLSHQLTHDNKFVCNICGDVVSGVPSLKKHAQTHCKGISVYQMEERPLQCKICSAVVQKRYMKTHYRLHTGEFPYKCKHCEKAFRTSTAVWQHTKIHTQEKSHVCSECGKSFRRSSDLKVHFRSHTGERPYQCSFCEKRFYDNSALRKHKKLHTGVRDFQCNECKKSFARLSDLRNHLKLHFNREEFRCEHCNKCLSSASNLRRHKRKLCGKKPTKASTKK